MVIFRTNHKGFFLVHDARPKTLLHGGRSGVLPLGYLNTLLGDLLHIGDICDTLWGVALLSEWVGLLQCPQVMEAAPSIPWECEISQVWTQLWVWTGVDTARERSPGSLSLLGEFLLGSWNRLSAGLDVPWGCIPQWMWGCRPSAKAWFGHERRQQLSPACLLVWLHF